MKRKSPDSALVSRAAGESSRRRPNFGLAESDRQLYEIIRAKEDMGIWTGDMKRETNLPDRVFNKSLKMLIANNLIKEVPNIRNKGRKHYMAAEFEPSKEITGGDWYSEGSLDTEFINLLKEVSLRYISKENVVSRDAVADHIRTHPAFNVEISQHQVDEILRTLVLDDEIIEVNSTGYGDYKCIPVGKVCYRCKTRRGIRGQEKLGAMASIPCGICPQINFCSPDGVVNPRTCAHFQKWLDF